MQVHLEGVPVVLCAADRVVELPAGRVLELFEELALGIELTHIREPELLESYSVSAASVQAYDLHWLSLGAEARGERKLAVRHVAESMRLASETGAEYVVTVPGYGEHTAGAEERCRRSYAELQPLAVELGVTVLIEPLSPKRSTLFPSLRQAAELCRELGEGFGVLADTMHVLDCGEVPEAVIPPVEEVREVHLRGAEDTPPGRGCGVDFGRVLSEDVLPCIEYSARGEEELRSAVSYLRSVLF